MKFLKKLLAIALLIFVLYILLLFVFTDKTRSIFDNLWLKTFNENVLKLKWDLDEKSTNIDFKDIWSWANQILNTTTDYVKETKNKIDQARKTANDLWEKYEEAKENVKNAKETIDKASESIKEIQNWVENVKNIFN